MNKWAPLQSIGNLSCEEFLQTQWQKKYFLARQAFPNFNSALSADELAGLALEPEVQSRLIVEKPERNWQLEHGPFPEEKFVELPEKKWTLLVQNVDSLDPQINALLEAFRFIPSWRLDDIMISYASDGGSVGPHFDYYDVFLLQAEGKRRWKLGQHCDSHTPLLANQDMKILADFQQTEEYLLTPGDMLYIPPGTAHWGIAEGECMTISIGFRAPSHAEFVLEMAQEYSSSLDNDKRYTDKNLSLQHSSAEIRAEVVENLQAVLNKLQNNPHEIARVFGKMMTAPNIENNNNEVTSLEDKIKLNNFVRCAWYKIPSGALCFVNGESWQCSEELAMALSEYQAIEPNSLNPGDLEFIIELNREGFLSAAEEIIEEKR